MTSNTLQISDFRLAFGQNVLFDHFMHTFESGMYVFSGTSGVGKTSLMRRIAGLENDFTGSISLNGAALCGYCPEVYMMHQHYVSFPWLTLLENVLMVYKGHKKRVLPEDREEARRVMEQLGLGDQVNKIPSRVSGGQDQRDNIANALMNKWSRVFLFDEPSSALDETNTRLVGRLLREHQEKLNAIFIVITHQETLLKALGGKVLHFTDDFRLPQAGQKGAADA